MGISTNYMGWRYAGGLHTYCLRSSGLFEQVWILAILSFNWNPHQISYFCYSVKCNSKLQHGPLFCSCSAMFRWSNTAWRCLPAADVNGDASPFGAGLSSVPFWFMPFCHRLFEMHSQKTHHCDFLGKATAKRIMPFTIFHCSQSFSSWFPSKDSRESRQSRTSFTFQFWN